MYFSFNFTRRLAYMHEIKIEYMQVILHAQENNLPAQDGDLSNFSP